MWQTYDKFNQQSNIAFQSLMSSMWKQHKKAFGAAKKPLELQLLAMTVSM
jgi:hypothetical protein